MRLIIVRHAKAERESSTGRDDDRLLTRRGEIQARFLADALSRDQPRPDFILASGILRAVQTARIIQEALGATLQIEDSLETGRSASGAVDLIAAARLASPGRPVLVLVGHNPQLEHLVGVLTRGPDATAGVVRTGEAIVLEAPDDPAAPLVGGCRDLERRRLDQDAD